MDFLYKLRSFGYVEIGDDIWFSNLYFNALIKLKKSTGQIEIVDKFPNYGIDQFWLYSAVCYVNGYLVFIPNNSEEIVSYHIETKRFVSVALDPEYIGEKKTYFVNAYVYGQYVYMFPTGAKCMIRYDVSEHTVKYLDNCISTLIRSMPESFYCFYLQYEVVDGKIYFPFIELNAVAVFNVKDEKAEIRYIDIEGGCSTINYMDGCFYLASWDTPEIYCWDGETKEIKTYRGFPENVEKGHIFLFACSVEDMLLFLPEQSHTIVAFSTKTGELREIQKINDFDGEPMRTYFAQKGDGDYYVLTADMGYMHVLSYKDGRLSLDPYFYIDDSYNKGQIADFFVKQGYYHCFPEGEYAFQRYVKIIKHMEKKLQIRKKDSYGKHILNEMNRRRVK